MGGRRIRSVAVIGAGASGAVTAAALAAEEYFDTVRVFERREATGGTWIYDPDPHPFIIPRPGQLPPETDPPLEIPQNLPATTPPTSQQKYEKTPVHAELTTNVPAIAMSFSDAAFAYGPFVPHWVPKQYIQNYFSAHKADDFLVLGTTVEDVSRLRDTPTSQDRWSLTLRRHDPVKNVDKWWKEEFDAVILANGHYSIPFVPHVDGLQDYIERFPGRVIHSKSYRSAYDFKNQKVLVIGNSASGHDVANTLVKSAKLPVYQSRRSKSRWEGDDPPDGISWKPIVKEYLASGTIVFADGTSLPDIDTIIYCTGYKVSFPFWNTTANCSLLWDYTKDRLVGNYLHTFFTNFPTLAIVGIPRALTFRSFEYQAIAIARVFTGRNSRPLPTRSAQEQWENDRENLTRREKRKFHDILWDNGETLEYLDNLYTLAGLPKLEGQGRCPPILGEKTRWAIEHVKKYPEPGKDQDKDSGAENATVQNGWVVVKKGEEKDSLHFI